MKIEWEYAYRLVQNYYKHHGNVSIKQSFKTINGFEYDAAGISLGAWLNNQKTKYKKGLLSKKQIKELENLGINFENIHDIKWQKMYDLAKAFYEKNGHLNVSPGFKTKDGYSYDEKGYDLAKWVYRQRFWAKEENLSDIRIKQLEDIGMVFECLHDIKWEEMYNLAKEYYNHHGHLIVPQKFKTKNGYIYDEKGEKLGFWINVQRKKYISNKLSVTRIMKLESINMCFGHVREYQWERMFNLAQTYYNHHGHLIVPQRFKTINGYDYDENGDCLQTWCYNQRSEYREGLLTDERIKKLESIGMIFEHEKNKIDNLLLCEQYGIDYEINKKLINKIPYRELVSKINYLKEHQLPIVDNDILNPIFSMSNLNMEVRYGINLETLIAEYYFQSKVKKI